MRTIILFPVSFYYRMPGQKEPDSLPCRGSGYRNPNSYVLHNGSRYKSDMVCKSAYPLTGFSDRNAIVPPV